MPQTSHKAGKAEVLLYKEYELFEEEKTACLPDTC
jgi:hypothetical protein